MSIPALQSHLRYPLTRLLGNGGNIRVLRAMLEHGAPLSAVQLSRDTGLTRQGARLVLDGLIALRVVTVYGPPRSQLFSVAAEHPFTPALKALFEQERGRWDALQQSLASALALQKGVRSAWLYGSVARGEDAPHSDIDIAMVVDEHTDTASKVRDSLQELGIRLGVHFSVVALTPVEVARLLPGDRWWSEMEKDAKVLKGFSPQQEARRCSRTLHPA